MGNVTLDRRALEHRVVAITGRLASMSREEAMRRLAEAGAVYVKEPTPETDLLVVGQGGPPLGEDGRLTASLRTARDLREAGSAIEIVPEEELLAHLGVEGFDLDRLYTTEQLGRILGVSRQQDPHTATLDIHDFARRDLIEDPEPVLAGFAGRYAFHMYNVQVGVLLANASPLCLDMPDLWISKAIAGRPKDVEFCQALVARGLVLGRELTERLSEVDELDERVRAVVARRIP